MSRNPIDQFLYLFERAQRDMGERGTAVTLATVDGEGQPAARVVLLKQVDQSGLVFYTNRESRKARELEGNPRAALCVWWPDLGKQARIEGVVEPVGDEESDAYFASRPRGSQIGAWTSKQSQPLASRAVLVARYLQMRARFAGGPVPRPPFWGGYRLIPARIEIWHHQAHRLHDREVYLREGENWSRRRLYP